MDADDAIPILKKVLARRDPCSVVLRRKTAFIVYNAGKKAHSFEVNGNGIDKKFITSVDPGKTKVLHVVLKSGSYKVYCPLDGHEKKGMAQTLTVG